MTTSIITKVHILSFHFISSLFIIIIIDVNQQVELLERESDKFERLVEVIRGWPEDEHVLVFSYSQVLSFPLLSFFLLLSFCLHSFPAKINN